MMRKRLATAAALAVLLLTASAAQQPAPQGPTEKPILAKPQTYTAAPKKQVLPPEVPELITRQFGEEFEAVADFPTPMLQADFDGDGVQDCAIVAQSKNPLGGGAEYHYTVTDPQNAYFGYGDPRMTAKFNVGDDRVKTLLIIHGAGEEGWKAATPKAKFVLINVPFDRLSLGLFQMKKKKTVVAISAHESAIMSSFVYFDGKKYRWQPNAAE